jgi:hypothetical protein
MKSLNLEIMKSEILKPLNRLRLAAGLLLLAIAALALGSCAKPHTDEIWDAIHDHTQRLDDIEAWQEVMSRHISNLQSLVDAQENGDCITSATPFATPAPGGYRIEFLKGEPITIYNGHTGSPSAPAAALQVSVAAEDGRYYWTLNGAPLEGEAGQKLWVTGNDGQSGATPQLRINDNQWEMSTGGGTWTPLGQATGDPGDPGEAFFADIDITASDHVTFTLDDGQSTTFQIPWRRAAVAQGITGSCTWTLTGTDGDYTLTISGQGAMGDEQLATSLELSPYTDGIRTVVIEDGVTAIGYGAFKNCTGLTNVTIGHSVEIIGEQAFRNCAALTDVTIPNSVKTIDDSAFYDTGLTNVTIPNSVTTIGEGAFAYCDYLTGVTIGHSVEIIGNGAFAKCTNLTEITCLNPVPPGIGDETFLNTPVTSSCMLRVPDGSVTAYRAKPFWKNLGTIAAIGGAVPDIYFELPTVESPSEIRFTTTNKLDEVRVVTAALPSPWVVEVLNNSSSDYNANGSYYNNEGYNGLLSITTAGYTPIKALVVVYDNATGRSTVRAVQLDTH